jgi:hypothetical protein
MRYNNIRRLLLGNEQKTSFVNNRGRVFYVAVLEEAKIVAITKIVSNLVEQNGTRVHRRNLLYWAWTNKGLLYIVYTFFFIAILQSTQYI